MGYGPRDRKEPDLTEAAWDTHGFSSSHGDVRVGPRRRLNAKEFMLLNCGAGDYSESFVWQGDQTCQF